MSNTAFCGLGRRPLHDGDHIALVRSDLELLRERLVPKFEVDPKTQCWPWIACLGAGGYGVIRFKGRNLYAHRASYEAFVGPVPDGLTLDHLCRVRHCVNPAHLDPVTMGENIRRGIRHNSTKTHCPSGHEYSVENTYITTSKHRICRKCQAAHERNRRARLKAATA